VGIVRLLRLCVEWIGGLIRFVKHPDLPLAPRAVLRPWAVTMIAHETFNHTRNQEARGIYWRFL